MLCLMFARYYQGRSFVQSIMLIVITKSDGKKKKNYTILSVKLQIYPLHIFYNTILPLYMVSVFCFFVRFRFSSSVLYSNPHLLLYIRVE
jgi:hypothetical protein